jgi:hypothetical protein
MAWGVFRGNILHNKQCRTAQEAGIDVGGYESAPSNGPSRVGLIITAHCLMTQAETASGSFVFWGQKTRRPRIYNGIQNRKKY